MAGTSGSVLKDSTVAQISAAIYYQAQVVSKITTNKQFQKKFQSVIFKQIDQDRLDLRIRFNITKKADLTQIVKNRSDPQIRFR